MGRAITKQATSSGQITSSLSFAIEVRLPGAGGRAGTLTLPHGTVETPAFMVVGTQATVKSLTPDELRGLGTQMILGNAYHLYLRPGADLIAEFGGLHSFMHWDGPILTDSGGFQVFSLGFALEHGVGKIAKIFPGEETQAPKRAQRPKLTRIDDDGVTFTSHLNGSTHRFNPEVSIGIEQQLGADVIVAFEIRTSPLHDQAYTARALQRTHHWADRSLQAGRGATIGSPFRIVQGGAYQDLRLQSAEFFAARPFPGYCIGGSLGKDKADMRAILEWTLRILPPERPRHLLGIGEPEDLFAAIERGIDLFDLFPRFAWPVTARSIPPTVGSRSRVPAIFATSARSRKGVIATPASGSAAATCVIFSTPEKCWASDSPRSTTSTSSLISSALSGRVSSMAHSPNSATVFSPAIWHRANKSGAPLRVQREQR